MLLLLCNILFIHYSKKYNCTTEKRYKWREDVYVQIVVRWLLRKARKMVGNEELLKRRRGEEKYSKDCSGRKQRRGKFVGHLKFFHPQQGGRLNWHLLDHRQLVRRIEVVVSSSSSRFLNLKFGIRSKGFFFDAFTMLVTLLPFSGKVSRESCKL